MRRSLLTAQYTSSCVQFKTLPNMSLYGSVEGYSNNTTGVYCLDIYDVLCVMTCFIRVIAFLHDHELLI